MGGVEDDSLLVIIVPASSRPQALARAQLAVNHLMSKLTHQSGSRSSIELIGDIGHIQIREYEDDSLIALPIETADADKLVTKFINATESAMRNRVEEIRGIFRERTSDEILKDQDARRTLFPNDYSTEEMVQVFADQGQPIRSRSELEDYRERHSSLWVVPAEKKYNC